MIDWIFGVIIIIVYICVRNSYKRKYNFIVNNYNIKFHTKEFSKLNKIEELIFLIMIIINMLFFNSDNVFVIGLILIMMPLSFYKNKFIVHSGGILMQGEEYSPKDILSYHVMRLSKTYVRFRIFMNECNKKRYKSVTIKNQYKEDVVKALHEVIYAKDIDSIKYKN